MEERLQKVLAAAGLGSRRSCESLITSGRVAVDGRVVTELGVRVDPDVASITVDGQPVFGQEHRYVLLNKPAGYVSGRDARSGYPSALELVTLPVRLYPVGRLDHDSEGLLLLTNDGELANRLTHPRFEHPKTYLVQVEGVPDPRKIRRLQHGVMLEDGPTLPARAMLLPEAPFARQAARPGAAGEAKLGRTGGGGPMKQAAAPASARTSWLKVTLREGRKRQLRRMVGLLGHPALRVIRIGLGPLQLGDLQPGKWRELLPGEVEALRLLAARNAARSAAKDRATERGGRMPGTIAVDGPSASGKSTIGGLLAAELGYLYFDTGVMYRAVAAVALARGVRIHDEAAVTALAQEIRIEVRTPTAAERLDGRDVTVQVDGEDVTLALRDPKVERAVSPVSAYPGVREAMVRQQRRIGQAGRIVMVGRDIGTVVLPDADLKIYLDARLAERSRRRYRERLARGEQVEPAQVFADMQRRDEYDSTRPCSPLAAAEDAVIIDSTDLTVEQVLARVRQLVRRSAA